MLLDSDSGIYGAQIKYVASLILVSSICSVMSGFIKILGRAVRVCWGIEIHLPNDQTDEERHAVLR